MSNSSLQAVLDSGNLNDIADAAGKLGLGTLLGYLVAKATATESGVSPASNVATLANAPVANGLFQVNATAGTTTGIKKLRQGPITGPSALVPATGECVWDGAKSVLFAAVDAVSAASFTYAVSTDLASRLLSDLPSGQSTLS
jgi:hypothetical protein